MKLGSSLPVPSVQELAKESLSRVPPRYVRSHHDAQQEDADPFSSTVNFSLQVPIIDFSDLSPDLKASELHKFHSACQHWGFFQVINHGVEESLVERVKNGIREFLNLPMEQKKKFWQTAEDVEGFGQGFVVSEEQKLDWADMFYMLTHPPSLRKPHLFPNLPLPFKDDLEAYSAEMRKLALNILGAMVEALGLEEKEMREFFEEGWQSMRMNYYPPCPEPELVNGLSPHSDGSGLTILLQVNEADQGLQIRKDGSWIPVTFLPNAFIVNIGDMLEVVTNGIYKSIEHRATVSSKKERISMATFYSPKLDGDLSPAPSLVTPERLPLFRRIGVTEFFKGFVSRELVGKSYLDTIRIQNN
ncbi:oxoglutarate-dependent flavonoid 7-O-demethylase 1-like isoform X1 [Prosopis cineraria]|uniref:oxoglutarate-dependent flavonoid 7-O-demethylase 1-like isoform X1 n=1 Tax=Prosopis cineraria TaxID=364024 RepID=UPI00240EACA8|nr:oxoglutarate-dependent flavonoid 7-O-demethylase 1-like isoform X1 [Prosopis cineraria]